MNIFDIIILYENRLEIYTPVTVISRTVVTVRVGVFTNGFKIWAAVSRINKIT